MAIHYVLRENKRTADPNDYYAVVVPTASVSQEEFLNRLASAGSTLNLADMLAFLQVFGTTMLQSLLNGETVVLGFANFSVSIRGVFNSAADTFDPSRGHTMMIQIEVGPVLRNPFTQQAVAQKQVAALPEPILVQYKNANTGELNATAKSGGLGQINGDKLKINVAAADEGVFFVPATGPALKVAAFTHNAGTNLAFQNPVLTAQNYTIEVRHRFGGPTSALRIGTLPVQVMGVP